MASKFRKKQRQINQQYGALMNYIGQVGLSGTNEYRGDQLVAAIAQRERLSYSNLAQYADQADVYTKSSWVYSAVNIKATACSLVNFQVFTVNGEDKIAAKNHPLEVLLRQPNQHSTRLEFIEATVSFLELTGNAYWFINGAPNNPQELLLLRPDMVRIVPGLSASEPVAGYVYECDGQSIPLDAIEVCHFSLFNPKSYYYGLSRLQALALAVMTDVGAAAWNRNFFNRDQAIPSGVVNIKTKVTKPEFDRLREEWLETYGGTERKTAFLRNADVEYQTIGLSHNDLDFIAGRQFSKEEIFLAFGIPAGLMDKNATEANATVADRLLNDKTVWPIMVRLGEKVTVDISRPMYGDNVIVEPEDIRFKDKADERAEIRTATPFLLINEIRERYYQLPPVPDGNKFAAGAGSMTATPGSGRGEDGDENETENDSKDTEDSDTKALKFIEIRQIAASTEPLKIVDVFPVSRVEISTEPVRYTKAMATELEQFQRYAKKGKHVDAFTFTKLPTGVEIAAKALADVQEYDLLDSAKFNMTLGQGIDASNDPYWREKLFFAHKMTTRIETYFKALQGRVIEGIKHVESPISGKSLADIKRFLSYFDDQFWDEELDRLANVVLPIVEDAVRKGAITDANAMYMSTGVSFDESVFDTKAYDYAKGYTDKVLKAFGTTNRKGTGAIISRYVATPDAEIKDLIAAIQESGLFSGKRAAIVGITESTRAFGVGNYLAGDELARIAGVKNAVGESDLFFNFPGHPYCRCGLTSEFIFDVAGNIVGLDYRWHTVNDFIAAKCPICGPRNEMLLSEIVGKK